MTTTHESNVVTPKTQEPSQTQARESKRLHEKLARHQEIMFAAIGFIATATPAINAEVTGGRFVKVNPAPPPRTRGRKDNLRRRVPKYRHGCAAPKLRPLQAAWLGSEAPDDSRLAIICGRLPA